MRQFEAVALNEDHEEALRVNELFDEARAADPNTGLRDVLRMAEEEFTETFADRPGVQEFGYSVAKNAFRWWNYGTAYLREVELTDAPDLLTGQWLTLYGEEKDDAGDKLLALTPAYFQTFDLLERERVQRSLQAPYREPSEPATPLEGAPFNPFERTRKHAGLTLKNTLDAVYQALEGKHPEIQGSPVGFVYGQAGYRLEKPPRLSPRGAAYIITRSSSQSEDMEAVYIVEDLMPEDDQVMVMEPKAGRVVQACTILDLVDVVENGAL